MYGYLYLYMSVEKLYVKLGISARRKLITFQAPTFEHTVP